MSREFVHVGTHAEILSSGRGIAPGERVKESDLALTSKGELGPDQHLLDEEHLVDVTSFDGDDNGQSPADVKKRAADLEIEGRASMSAEKLRAAVAEREKATAPSAQEGAI